MNARNQPTDVGYIRWYNSQHSAELSQQKKRKRRRNSLVLIIAICALIYIGFSYQYETQNAQPREIFEGYWLQMGEIVGDEYVEYSDLTASQKERFAYETLCISEKKASISNAINSGDKESNDTCEWRPTTNGIRLGSIFKSTEFALDANGLLTCGNMYFKKYPETDKPSFKKLAIGDVKLRVPLELFYEAKVSGVDSTTDLGYLVSNRKNSARLIYNVRDSDYFTDITELAGIDTDMDFLENNGVNTSILDDYTEGVFRFHNGTNFYVLTDRKENKTSVEFIINEKCYKITFIYSDKDVLDYSNYATKFYRTIETGSTLQSADLPDGAMTWEHAWEHLNKSITVFGPVKSTSYKSCSDFRQTYIDIGMEYPDWKRLTLIVWGEDRYKFPDAPEDFYKDKTIAVTGTPYVFKDIVYIKISSPKQIQVLEE